MILAKAPLRVSLIGGGTDFPSFFRRHGGSVISVSIDKYVYVALNRSFDDRIRLNYSEREEVDWVEDVRHKYLRTLLMHHGIRNGVDISSFADIPGRGTGLSSSAAFLVACTNALRRLQGLQALTTQEMCESSIRLEIDVLSEPVGIQDHYSVCHPGLKKVDFFAPRNASVTCLEKLIQPDRYASFIESLTLIGNPRGTRSSSILVGQSASTDAGKLDELLLRLNTLTEYFYAELLGSCCITRLGSILLEAWGLKKQFQPGIVGQQVEDLVEILETFPGCLGYKLLGAGGGGFILVIGSNSFRTDFSRRYPFLRLFPLGVDYEGPRTVCL